MPTLNYPTLSILPSASTFSLVPNTMEFHSPLNGATQTAELPGARWAGQYSYDTLTDPDIRILQAFLAQLRGRAGRFFAHDISHPTPSGTALGTPVVATAAIAGATTLATSGWTANQAAVMKAGDYFTTSTGELKIIVTSVASSPTGTATLTFEPPARAAIPLASAIDISSASATVMLADDYQDQIDLRPPVLGSVTLKFVEAFS